MRKFSQKAEDAAKAYGYRSGLEKTVEDELKQLNIDVKYESIKIEWDMVRGITTSTLRTQNQ